MKIVYEITDLEKNRERMVKYQVQTFYNGTTSMSSWGTELNSPASWLEAGEKVFSVQQTTYSTDTTYFYWKTT